MKRFSHSFQRAKRRDGPVQGLREDRGAVWGEERRGHGVGVPRDGLESAPRAGSEDPDCVIAGTGGEETAVGARWGRSPRELVDLVPEPGEGGAEADRLRAFALAGAYLASRHPVSMSLTIAGRHSPHWLWFVVVVVLGKALTHWIGPVLLFLLFLWWC